MILLYKVCLSPDAYPGLHDGMCLDEFSQRQRWWNSRTEAEKACGAACELIGPRPRPGIQHERPIPIAVLEVRYADALAMARGEVESVGELSRVWQFADGTVSDERPVWASKSAE